MPRHGIPFTAFNRSSMRELVIGIDSGTQSTKALVVDANNGKVLGEGAKAHRLIGGLPAGAKEQNPADWIDATQAGIRAALKQARANAGEVRAIGVSGQQHGFVPLDKKGAVRPNCGATPPLPPSATRLWPSSAASRALSRN